MREMSQGKWEFINILILKALQEDSTLVLK